jgi:acyl-CoA thioester hydrolase
LADAAVVQALLEEFPVVVEWPVAWGEMDAFGHVNNVVYFRYFENARLAYFRAVGYMETMEQSGLGPILASTQCRFRLPLEYPDTVSVGARVRQLRADRFLMEYRVASQRHGAVAAEGNGAIVSYDYRSGAKAPVPDAVRRAIEDLEGAAATA